MHPQKGLDPPSSPILLVDSVLHDFPHPMDQDSAQSAPSGSFAADAGNSDTGDVTMHDDSTWFSMQQISEGYHVVEYDGALRVYGHGSTFMDKFDADEHASIRRTQPYYPFASRDEWELATFLLESSLSMASIDCFLKLELVCSNFYYLLFPIQANLGYRSRTPSFHFALQKIYKVVQKFFHVAHCGNRRTG